MVLDSIFCVAKGIIELKSKSEYGGSMIKKQHYWPKRFPGGLIDTHFEYKEVGNVEILAEITQDNTSFRIFCMEYPDYAMKIMASWTTVYELEGANIGRHFIEISVMKEAKHFKYRQTFGISFRYMHQVYEHNNWRHAHIFLDRTRATKFCPGCNFDWYLAVSEDNTALASGHCQNDGVVQPSMSFWRAFAI